MTTIRNALKETTLLLEFSRSPRADAELLLSHTLGCERSALLFRLGEELSDSVYLEFKELIRRRLSGEPLQYITGWQGFMGHMFSVNSDVLIPRYDTETLADCAIKLINGMQKGNPPKVLDIGTGSGAIAISIALAVPDAQVFAVDISAAALEVARRNATLLGADVVFFQNDLLNDFGRILSRGDYAPGFDMVVSNPPYITTHGIAALDEEVRCYEPLTALDGGIDGLFFYRKITASAPAYMSEGAYLLFEVGYGQARETGSFFQAAKIFDAPFYIEDINGIERVTGARLIKKTSI